MKRGSDTVIMAPETEAVITFVHCGTVIKSEFAISRILSIEKFSAERLHVLINLKSVWHLMFPLTRWFGVGCIR